MSVLGRGLSSLIPKRFTEDAEEMLEQIDNMDEIVPEEEAETETKEVPVAPEETTTPPEAVVSVKPVMVEAEEETEETKEADEAEETPADDKDLLDIPEKEEEVAPPEQAKAVKEVSASLASDELKEIGDMESDPMPPKPNVTPLTIDPETGALRDAVATTAAATAVPKVTKRVAATSVRKKQHLKVTALGKAPRVAEVTPPAPVAEAAPEKEEVVKAEPVMKEVETVSEATVVVDTTVVSESEAVIPSDATIDHAIWDKHEDTVQHIPINDIEVNPLQPRRTFDPEEMEELVSSIDQHGILQPLVVMRKGDKYELVAGERRLRAAKQLGWDKVPSVVRTDVNTNRGRLELALIENVQRENLNPIEEAMGYKRLNEEFGMSHEEIGTRVGRSRVGITNVIRILQLPAEIQRGLMDGKITLGHARAILMIPDEEKQIRFYHHLLDEGLTVRKAETRARRIQRQMKVNDPLRKKTRGRPELALKYDGPLEEKFGYNARIKFDENKNRFEVNFYAFSEKEAEELVARLLGAETTVEYPEDSAE